MLQHLANVRSILPNSAIWPASGSFRNSFTSLRESGAQPTAYAVLARQVESSGPADGAGSRLRPMISMQYQNYSAPQV